MRLLLIVFASVAAILALLADVGAMTPALARIHAMPSGDKLLHVTFAGGLALLVNAVLVSRSATLWRPLAVGTALVAAVATAEEASNLLTPHRGYCVADLAANYAGILILGFVPVAAWRASRPGPSGRAT